MKTIIRDHDPHSRPAKFYNLTTSSGEKDIILILYWWEYTISTTTLENSWELSSKIEDVLTL